MRATMPIPIAVVMTSFDAGGTERQMVELVRRLDRTRWAVHLACLHARGPGYRRAAEAAQSVTEFPIQGFGRPETCRQALAFARWCGERRITVVHTVDLYTNIFGLPAAALARVAVRVGSRRGHNQDRTSGQLMTQRAALSCAHAIVVNSAAMSTRLQAERVAASKITVVPNGLDLALYNPTAHRALRRRVIVVANLRPEKGHDVLIDAAAEVLRDYPDARFCLVGDGPDSASIRARLTARGIADAFSLLGSREDVPALLEAADICVLPSRTESLPNSVLEAMATALPVVASAVGGVPELIDDGRNGLLTPAGDAPALADRLRLLMSDPARATRLGEAARDTVAARYSFERMVSAMEAVYFRELDKRRARNELAA